jgi:hypothetical protein
LRRTLILLGLIGFGLTLPVSAATNAQDLAGIWAGLAHLAYQQCPGTPTSAISTAGSWSTAGSPSVAGNCSGSNNGAFTGMALFAFMANKTDWNPALVTQYNTVTANAAAFLLQTANVSSVSTNDKGQSICPGGAPGCTAIYWTNCDFGYSTYCTGFAAQALDVYALAQGAGTVATTTGPLAGMTWLQVAQGMNNAFGAAQATSNDGNYNGGWHYFVPTNTSADMSTTQWGAIVSGYGEAVGAITAATVKPALAKWLAYDLTSYPGAPTGAACYEGSAGCTIGPTNSENGAWLVSNAYAGSPISTGGPIAFLSTNWNTTVSSWSGNFSNTYAMWASYKGLEAAIGLADTTHISNLTTAATNCGIVNHNTPANGICNWFEDYREWLTNGAGTANATDGGGNLYWTGSSAGGGGADWTDPLSTAVDVAILGAVPLPATITNTTPTAPALSQWGLVVLCILLVTFACMKLRGKQTA